MRLRTLPDGSVEWRDGSGRVVLFTLSPTGAFLSSPGEEAVLRVPDTLILHHDSLRAMVQGSYWN